MKKYLLLTCLFLVGCQPLQQTARDSIAVAKGAIETAQQEYLVRCLASPTDTPCEIIKDAIAAQNLVVDVGILYCAGNDAWLTGGPCSPSRGVEPRLKEALLRLDTIISNVKELLK
ncbi:hypothetical protein LCGC14_2465690 [marine sediment metagenome]|uniref:Lipoprotein n=1 Tax=marine sediment metagenome TaxID=412755 RepID=A0A0F9BZN9_9ZZZZ